jgi:hypothetical protein
MYPMIGDPFGHPVDILYDSVLSYRLTALACASMAIAWAYEIRKRRTASNGRPLLAPIWPMSFYWPVGIWGFQALGALLDAGHGISVSVYIWKLGYSSALACAWVLITCACISAVVGSKIGARGHHGGAIPAPACAMIASVSVVYSSVLIGLETGR